MKLRHFYYLCVFLGSMALGFFVVSGVKTEKAAMDYSPKFSSGQMATESAEYRNIVSSISSKAQDELDSYRKQTALEFSSSTGGSMSGSETERLLFTFPEIPEFSILSQNGWSNSGKYLIIKTEDINRLWKIPDWFKMVSITLWPLAQAYSDTVTSYTSEQRLYTFQQSIAPSVFLLPYSQISGITEREWWITKRMAYGKSPETYFWKSRNKAKVELFFSK